MADKTLDELSEATRARYSKPQPYRGVVARFPRAILALAEVSMYGTRKHDVPLDDKSFLRVPEAEVSYVEAELRHMLKEAIEGPYDADGDDLHHKAEKAWNAMADLEKALTKTPLRLRSAVGSGPLTPEPHPSTLPKLKPEDYASGI